MPRPHLVISDGVYQDWYVADADKALISDYERRIITVEGRPEYIDLLLADGKEISVCRILRDIIVLESE
jgi:hypothetical protein